MKRENWLFVCLSVLVILFFPFKLIAAPYYEGKVIKIIVGPEPGGGYDRITRLLAKYLPKYIPGKPAFIVENMVGAGSLIACNYVYNTAKPDGLTILNFNRGIPFAQMMKAEGVRFDLMKYSWIGSAAVEATVLVLRTDLPYKSVDDLLKAKGPIHLAAVGPTTTDYQFPILLKEFAGFNFNMVIYRSGGDSRLAIERKEVDGKAGAYSSQKPFIDRGLVRPIIRGRVSEPGIENLPVDEDLTTDKMGKTIMALLSTQDLVGRPYVSPPGTPAEMISILRDAFASVTKDPELREEAKKSMLSIEYVSADECLKMYNYVLTQPPNIVQEFGKYIKF